MLDGSSWDQIHVFSAPTFERRDIPAEWDEAHSYSVSRAMRYHLELN
jgi:hypothetical protein